MHVIIMDCISQLTASVIIHICSEHYLQNIKNSLAYDFTFWKKLETEEESKQKFWIKLTVEGLHYNMKFHGLK